MQLSLKGSGLLEAGKLLAWTQRNRQTLRDSVGRGFKESGPQVAAKVQRNVSGALNIRRRGFLASYHSTIYTSKPDRLPSMAVGSKVRFTGIQEHGGPVQPKGRLLLIPFPRGPFANSMGGARVGPKRFKEIIRALMASGNAFFKQVNGRLILFAENIAESDKQLRGFKRYQRRQTGAPVKRGTEIPIAIALPATQLSKKTDVLGTVRSSLPDIVAAIESQIARSAANGR